MHFFSQQKFNFSITILKHNYRSVYFGNYDNGIFVWAKFSQLFTARNKINHRNKLYVYTIELVYSVIVLELSQNRKWNPKLSSPSIRSALSPYKETDTERKLEREARNRYIHLLPPPFCVPGDMGECRFVSALLLISCCDGCDSMFLLAAAAAAAAHRQHRGSRWCCELAGRRADSRLCFMWNNEHMPIRSKLMRWFAPTFCVELSGRGRVTIKYMCQDLLCILSYI